MDVNLASQTQKVPHVGFPQREPVISEIKQNTEPTGAILFDINGKILILKIKLPADVIPINAKQPIAINDEGTWTYIILTLSPWIASGGEVTRALINPTVITDTINTNNIVKILLLNESNLLGKNFLNINRY